MSTAKAAVLERSRRPTAGKRMSALIGKAQEDDEAFWSHPVWSEAGGGFSKRKKRSRCDDESSSGSGSASENGSVMSDGEGSYRISDDDSEAAVDQFDSDFDDSESEREEEEGEAEEERQLRAEERQEAAAKRKKKQRFGMPVKSVVSSAGRELIKKKQGKGIGGWTKKGPMGEGWNAGLVLNWPPSDTSVSIGSTKPCVGHAANPKSTTPPDPAAAAAASKGGAEPKSTISTEVLLNHTSSMTSTATSPISKPQLNVISSLSAPRPDNEQIVTNAHTPLSTRRRNLRAGTLSKSIATAHSVAQSTRLTQQRQAAIEKKKKNIQKRKFTQEELVLEAVKVTEAENAKWLSARKRIKEETASSENPLMVIGTGGKNKSSSGGSSDHTPILRFHSRRGCYNTLTFLDMDHLPPILSRKHCPKVEEDSKRCVITGKVAKYRDPKSMMGYHDVNAFKELRRRLEIGDFTSYLTPECARQSGSSSSNGVGARNKVTSKTTSTKKGNHPTTIKSTSATTLQAKSPLIPNTGINKRPQSQSNAKRKKALHLVPSGTALIAKQSATGPDITVTIRQGGAPVSPVTPTKRRPIPPSCNINGGKAPTAPPKAPKRERMTGIKTEPPALLPTQPLSSEKVDVVSNSCVGKGAELKTEGKTKADQQSVETHKAPKYAKRQKPSSKLVTSSRPTSSQYTLPQPTPSSETPVMLDELTMSFTSNVDFGNHIPVHDDFLTGTVPFATSAELGGNLVSDYNVSEMITLDSTSSTNTLDFGVAPLMNATSLIVTDEPAHPIPQKNGRTNLVAEPMNQKPPQSHSDNNLTYQNDNDLLLGSNEYVPNDLMPDSNPIPMFPHSSNFSQFEPTHLFMPRTSHNGEVISDQILTDPTLEDNATTTAIFPEEAMVHNSISAYPLSPQQSGEQHHSHQWRYSP